eukprot:TRINITY_DN30185_c0_g1_i1.p1 TRINITY_DN30185_c0_g1~~TRINITY_DN30185_c0_g1_i1.p1  ORF type:complete len:194 (-),score=19.36 TRINITY_DN30185_c0_g1_i1:57-638(-)
MANDEPNFFAIVYTVSFLWISVQFTVLLSALDETHCPTTIVVLVAVNAIVLLGLSLSHCLTFASYQDSRHISVRYDRERRKLKANAKSVRHYLQMGLRAAYIIELMFVFTKLPLLIIQGLPPYREDDGNLGCRIGFCLLWIESVAIISLMIGICIVKGAGMEQVETYLEDVFAARTPTASVWEEYAKADATER